MSSDRHSSGLRRMLVLAMAPSGCHERPAMGLKESDEVSDFHARRILARGIVPEQLSRPVLTADRIWSRVKIGVEVVIIR